MMKAKIHEVLGDKSEKLDEGVMDYVCSIIESTDSFEDVVESVTGFFIDSGCLDSRDQVAALITKVTGKAPPSPLPKPLIAQPTKPIESPAVVPAADVPTPKLKESKKKKPTTPSTTSTTTATPSSLFRTAAAANITLEGDLVYFEKGATLFSGNHMTLLIEDTLILDEANLTLMRGHRYGMIGPNGSGKTTLMSALRRSMESKGARVQYVGQNDGERLAACDKTLLEHVLDGDTKRTALLDVVTSLSSNQSTLSSEEAERLGEAMAELEGYNGEEEARTLLKQLGFRNVDTMLVSHLSGGWRSRLEVARALWVNSDILMLDEPTNHMDLEAVLQLGGILLDNNSNRTLLLVSHDAAFLDLVCTDTLCMHNGTEVIQFDGPYATFEEHCNQQRTFHADMFEAREKQEKALKDSLRQQRERAAREGDSARAQQAAARAKKMDRIGLYRVDGRKYKTHSLKIMDASAVRLPARAEPVKEAQGVNMHLPSWIQPIDTTATDDAATTKGPDLIQVTPMVVGPHWGPNGTALLRTPSLNVAAGDRIAIVGENGCGKTTLMHILAAGCVGGGDDGGGVTQTTGGIAVIDQNQLAALDGDMASTPVQWIIRKMTAGGNPRPQEEARKQLACFAITGDTAETPIGQLSGGLRVRLLLAGVFVGNPRVLLLDEPTNHLDGESIMSLVDLCKSFPGAIIGVSHHVAFLLQVFRDLWVIKDGVLKVQKCQTASAFSLAFGAYAQPLIPARHRAAFADMMHVRAARSAIIVSQPSTSASLIV